jgi:transposase
MGRPRALTLADEKALFMELQTAGWYYQDEMIKWLMDERGVVVSQPTISAMLKRNNWTRKSIKLMSNNRNEGLRHSYLKEISIYSAEQLVFIDESISNEKTERRTRGYAPFGSPSRYLANINRSQIHSIFPALTVDGFLPYTGIKQGYYSREDLLDWIEHDLLPAVRAKFGDRLAVIVLNNVSIHIGREVIDLIESAGYLVQFLPPYSPDFNSIGLVFSVLKAWVRRHYYSLRPIHPNYLEFLKMAVEESGCDRFALRQFKHAANGHYLMRDNWEQVQQEKRQFIQGLTPSSTRRLGYRSGNYAIPHRC